MKKAALSSSNYSQFCSGVFCGLVLSLAAVQLRAQPGPDLADVARPHVRYLVLDKPGFTKRIRFYPGDELRFRLKNDRVRYRGELQAVREKSIIILNAEILLSDISSVMVSRKSEGSACVGRSAGSLAGRPARAGGLALCSTSPERVSRYRTPNG